MIKISLFNVEHYHNLRWPWFSIIIADVLCDGAHKLNESILLFKKWTNPGLFSVYFRSFLITVSIQIEKSIDGVLGIRTHGRRMVGADETTELWRLPKTQTLFLSLQPNLFTFLYLYLLLPTVWPELATFRHFGQNLKSLWHFSESLFSIWPNCEAFAIGQMFCCCKWPNIAK